MSRIVSQGGIVIGSILKFQNLEIAKLRKNGAKKQDDEMMQAMMAVSSKRTLKVEPFGGK